METPALVIKISRDILICLMLKLGRKKGPRTNMSLYVPDSFYCIYIYIYIYIFFF